MASRCMSLVALPSALILGLVGCSPGPQASTTAMTPGLMAPGPGLSPDQLRTLLPERIPAGEALSKLVYLDGSQVRDGDRSVQIRGGGRGFGGGFGARGFGGRGGMGWGGGRWRGGYGGYGWNRGWGGYGGYGLGGYAGYYYPYGGYYYPYTYSLGYYYPYYSFYNPYYTYPVLYPYGSYYYPYSLNWW